MGNGEWERQVPLFDSPFPIPYSLFPDQSPNASRMNSGCAASAALWISAL
jgi:hypothetical protein